MSYNSLEGYGASLQHALTEPYPAYEAIGVRASDGSYRQLGTSLLQIENEFYGTIRPKRVIFQGERPLHALRERGVEYVEVRLMDLDPFEPLGINAQTLRFLDVFLLYCLIHPSPDDTPQEIAAMARNQQRVAERGREPGLELERDEKPIGLAVWGQEIVKALAPIAKALDAAHGSADYSASLAAAEQGLSNPDTLPSARVLRAIEKSAEGTFASFIQAQSLQIKTAELSQALTASELAHFQKLADISRIDHARKEAADSMSFEQYLQQYLSPDRLGTPAAR